MELGEQASPVKWERLHSPVIHKLAIRLRIVTPISIMEEVAEGLHQTGIRPSGAPESLLPQSGKASSIGLMGGKSFNIGRFQEWATGNFVDNRNRGIFAEWMVGEALGCIKPKAFRVEWDSYDLLYGEMKVEVKASGLSQTWNPDNATIPKFTITGQKWTWLTEEEAEALPDQDPDAQYRRSGVWIENDPPSRPADVYVFCLHEALPATNKNVKDTDTWVFWVVATRTLDEVLGGQKTLGLKKLDSLAPRIPWNKIRAAVDDCQSA